MANPNRFGPIITTLGKTHTLVLAYEQSLIALSEIRAMLLKR